METSLDTTRNRCELLGCNNLDVHWWGLLWAGPSDSQGVNVPPALLSGAGAGKLYLERKVCKTLPRDREWALAKTSPPPSPPQ